MPELKDGCVKPAKGPLLPSPESTPGEAITPVQEVKKMLARIGNEAIDFEANAFVADVGFKHFQSIMIRR